MIQREIDLFVPFGNGLITSHCRCQTKAEEFLCTLERKFKFLISTFSTELFLAAAVNLKLLKVIVIFW